MILNVEEEFSDKQAITVTAISTNQIDLGVPGTPYGAQGPLNRDIGKGIPVPILIQVTEAFATLTSLTVEIVVADNSALTTNDKVIASEVIAAADLVVGKATYLQYLPNGVDQRYLGLRYTVTGSDATAGAITAGITWGNQTNLTGG